MKIIRYSKEGFKPQKQTYHVNKFESCKDLDLNTIPKHLQYEVKKIIEKKVKFDHEHKEDLQEGIWFFIDGYKNNQSLNHLKEKVPCWEAEIDDDVLVYDCNLEKIVSLNDPIVKFGGCYIPKKLIKNIKNIKRRKTKKAM